MADEVFGEGLEETVASTGGTDDFISQFRELMDGLPEDATRESLADYLEKVQNEAERAAELQKKLDEREAAYAQLSSISKPADAPATKAEAEAKRRYEVSQVSEQYQPYLKPEYVQVNPQTGMYEPKEIVRYSPDVSQACTMMNRRLQQQQRLIEDMSTDPYAFIDEGVKYSSFAVQMQKQFEDYKKEMSGLLQPMQQMTDQQNLEAFNMQHVSLLTQPKADNPNEVDWSPAGKVYQKLLGKGMHPEDAIEVAKEFAQATPAVPAKPAKPPVRTIDKIHKRTEQAGTPLSNRGPSDSFEVPAGKFRTSLRDVRNRVNQSVEE